MAFSHPTVRCTAAALLTAAAALTMTAASAAPRYDGVWSVAIVTKKGDCIASYRYPMRIAHGVLANGGAIALDVHGRVATNGLITVHLSHGDTHAAGVGRLSGNIGHGSWRGASCAGSWTAERRSL